MFGGIIDGKTTMIVGSPGFVIGEETLLFLDSRKSQSIENKKYGVLGLSQGKFDIVNIELTDRIIFEGTVDQFGSFIYKPGARFDSYFSVGKMKLNLL